MSRVETTGVRPSWLKGYKLRRDRVRKGEDWITQVDAGWETIVVSGGRDVGSLVEPLAVWASEIEQDLRAQREKLLSIPVQLQRRRLEDWDLTVGKERVAWTVCARELGKLSDGLTALEGRELWEAARRLWVRAVSIRENRRGVREVGK